MASEWRYEKGDRKSDTCSTESEYKNKLKAKQKIDKSQKDMLNRLCEKAYRSIYHILSGCSKLAQKYRRRQKA